MFHSKRGLTLLLSSLLLIIGFQNCSAPQEEVATSSKASKSGSSTSPELVDPGLSPGGSDPGIENPLDPNMGIPQTPPRDGEEAVFQVDTSFGKLTVACRAFANAGANIPMYVRCAGDATQQLKTSFGMAHTVPRKLRVWGYDLKLNFNTFSTHNADTEVFAESGCTRKHDYVVGSGTQVSITGSFVVPRCKSGQGNLDHCVDTTQCTQLPGTPYGTLYIKNKSVGWTDIKMTYENINR